MKGGGNDEVRFQTRVCEEGIPFLLSYLPYGAVGPTRRITKVANPEAIMSQAKHA